MDTQKIREAVEFYKNWPMGQVRAVEEVKEHNEVLLNIAELVLNSRFPEKYNIQSKVTGEDLPETNSRDIQYQYGWNAAIDACLAAHLREKAEWVPSVEEIEDCIDSHSNGGNLRGSDDRRKLAMNIYALLKGRTDV